MNEINVFIETKDFSVSGEEFKLVKNKTFGFLETTPIPSLEKLPSYYNSDDYISHTDAKRNLFETVYHLVRVRSLKKKIKLIGLTNANEKMLLDVGCGTGDFLQAALKANWNVFGVEPNENARRIANKKTNNKVFPAEKLNSFTPKSFDVITLWHVLEHLPNLEIQISIFKKLLKHNGKLIIAVPNYKSFDAQHYKKFWAAYDVPRHLWHFNQKAMIKLLQHFNLEVHAITPMWFDAFYVCLLSEKYKTGVMNPLKALSVGLYSNIKALRTKEASSLIYSVKNR